MTQKNLYLNSHLNKRLTKFLADINDIKEVKKVPKTKIDKIKPNWKEYFPKIKVTLFFNSVSGVKRVVNPPNKRVIVLHTRDKAIPIGK